MTQLATPLATPLALIFPGQGSQTVGMGQDWVARHAAARRTFEEADDALGFSLSGLCADGPAEDLQLTANTQPAILACSVAMFRALEEEIGDLGVTAVAGHSLGEYSAHVAAGTLDFGTALRLVRRRGELMQEAVPVGVGAMAAIMGLDADAVADVVAAVDGEGDEVCAVANLNSSLQSVIAGHRGAVEKAVTASKEAGAKVAKMLPVSAPFHSPLMAPARVGLTPDLDAASFGDGRWPVWTNIDAAPSPGGAGARDALIRQIDGPVRWTETITGLIGEGVGAFVEVGPGKVLTSLGKRIDRAVRWQALTGPDDLAELWAGLS